ncbi:MAG: hypothetical protein AB1696_20785 [Planctomycetota bacterium]
MVTLAVPVFWYMWMYTWPSRSYRAVRKRVLRASKQAGFDPVLIEFNELIRLGKHFPWRKKHPTHYVLVTSTPSEEMVAGLDLDDKGNLYVSMGTNVFRVERSGQIRPLIADAFLPYTGDWRSKMEDPRRICTVDHFAVTQDGSVLWIVSYKSSLYTVKNGEPRFMAGSRMEFDTTQPGQGTEARMAYILNIVTATNEKAVVACDGALCECDTKGNVTIIAKDDRYQHRDVSANDRELRGSIVAPHPDRGYWIVERGWGGCLSLLCDGKMSTIISGSHMTEKTPEEAWLLPGRGFNGPLLVILGPDRILYVAENESIVTVSPLGKMNVLMGSRERWRDRGWPINGLAVDRDGNLFTAHQDVY